MLVAPVVFLLHHLTHSDQTKVELTVEMEPETGSETQQTQAALQLHQLRPALESTEAQLLWLVSFCLFVAIEQE